MLTILGLGYGDPDALPARNLDALRSGVPVMLRTARHPTLEGGTVRDLLDALPPGTVTALDDEYERGASFIGTYSAIAARVMDAARTGDVVYAVPGHPLYGETTVALILEQAKDRGIPARVLAAPSFVDACLESLQMSVPTNLVILDAHTLDAGAAVSPPELRVFAPILLYQVHSRAVASETKLALMNAGYPDDFSVTALHAAGLASQDVRHIPLRSLDRADAGIHSHLTSVYVPPLPPELRPPGFDDLLGIMARLRDKDNGCPWDIKQSHATLRKYVIEEAYEVAEAIDDLEGGGEPEALCEELGDLLLQVVFHAQVAKEAGDFDQGDVCRAIVEKLIRRHPHIFGDVVAEDAETVLTNWNAIKAQEKGNTVAEGHPSGTESVLDGVNKSLPALSLALEMSRRAVGVGFEWCDTDAVLAKLDEEIGELRREIAAPLPDVARIESELGDVLFTAVNVARRFGVEPEDALRKQVTRFGKRFRFIEARYAERDLITLTPEEWLSAWKLAKENEQK